MNPWLKPREKSAAKGELNGSSVIWESRSLTKMAMASGTCAIKSHVSVGQMMLGVKRAPKGLDRNTRSHYGTLGTSRSYVCQSTAYEGEDKIGMKQMPRVMPRIDRMVNPRGRPLPMTLLDTDGVVIYP